MGAEFDLMEVELEEGVNNSFQSNISNIVAVILMKLPYVCLPEFYENIDTWSNFKSYFDGLTIIFDGYNSILKLIQDCIIYNNH